LQSVASLLRMSKVVLDASALLALLHQESGAEIVQTALPESVISAVNWSEVWQKTMERKVSTDGLREDLEALGLKIEPFTSEQAELAAQLREPSRSLGLSLGDRACLALALNLNVTAMTADKVWETLVIQVPIQVIR
jgi:ribonuclease VapC